MQKLTLLSLFYFFAWGAFAQQTTFSLENPAIRFFSDGAIEDIDAKNLKAVGSVDAAGKKFAFKVPVKQFVFKKSLMQDHFNENYMESDKYPEASFAGTIVGAFDLSKDGTYPVSADGNLTMHGITQKRAIPATIIVKAGKAALTSKFIVKLIDHKISIPKIMFQKIAEQVEVTINSGLK